MSSSSKAIDVSALWLFLAEVLTIFVQADVFLE